VDKHLAHGTRAADIEEEGAERARTARDAGAWAVVGQSEGGPGVTVEGRGQPGDADGGSERTQRRDVSGGSEQGGGGPERRHAATMPMAVEMSAIALMRRWTNIASGASRHYDRTRAKQ